MGDMRVSVGVSYMMQHHQNGERELVYCYAAKALAAYRTKLTSKVSKIYSKLNNHILSLVLINF